MPGIQRALQTALTRRVKFSYRYDRVGGSYRTIGPAAHNILHIQKMGRYWPVMAICRKLAIAHPRETGEKDG
jgi:hypothetical protein